MGSSSSTQQPRRRRRTKKEDDDAPEESRASQGQLVTHRASTRWTSRSFAEGRAMERYFADPDYHRGACERLRLSQGKRAKRGGHGRRGPTIDADRTNYYSNDYRRALQRRRARTQAGSQPSASSTLLGEGPPSSTDEDGTSAVDPLGTPVPRVHRSPTRQRRSPEAGTSLLSLGAAGGGESGTFSPSLTNTATASPRASSPPQASLSTASALRTAETNPTLVPEASDGGEPPSITAVPPADYPPLRTVTLTVRHTSTFAGATATAAGDVVEDAEEDEAGRSPLGAPSAMHTSDEGNSRGASLPATEVAAGFRDDSDLLSVATSPQLVDGADHGEPRRHADRQRSHADRHHRTGAPAARRNYAASDTSSRYSVRTVAHRSGFHSVAEPWSATHTRVPTRHRDASLGVSRTQRRVTIRASASGTRAGTRPPRDPTSTGSTTGARTSASTAAVERARQSARTRRRGTPNNWSDIGYTRGSRRGADGFGPVVFYSVLGTGDHDYHGDGAGGDGGGFADMGVF